MVKPLPSEILIYGMLLITLGYEKDNFIKTMERIQGSSLKGGRIYEKEIINCKNNFYFFILDPYILFI